MEKNKCEICGRKLKSDNKKGYCSKHTHNKCRCGNDKLIASRRCQKCYESRKHSKLSYSDKPKNRLLLQRGKKGLNTI